MEEGIRYVYTGNIPGLKGESTFCHSCSTMLIERVGFRVGKNIITDGHCPECGALIDGVEM